LKRPSAKEDLGQQDIDMAKCKGEELADIIEDRGFTVEKFCENNNLDTGLIQQVIDCVIKITPEIAEMLFKVTNFPASYWL